MSLHFLVYEPLDPVTKRFVTSNILSVTKLSERECYKTFRERTLQKFLSERERYKTSLQNLFFTESSATRLVVLDYHVIYQVAGAAYTGYRPPELSFIG